MIDPLDPFGTNYYQLNEEEAEQIHEDFKALLEKIGGFLKKLFRR